MPRNHLLTRAFTDATERLIANAAFPDDVLHSRAKRHIDVLRLPSFVDINAPAWVRRIQRFSSAHMELGFEYTSSRLFDAMYQIAEELQSPAGKRYVSAAICVCGSRIEATEVLPEDKPRRLVEALTHLATSWVAFMLWPFFANGYKLMDGLRTASWEKDIRELACPRYPCPGREGTDDETTVLSRCWHSMQDEIFRRDDYTCAMTGTVHSQAPFELRAGKPKCGVDFLTFIFPPPSPMQTQIMDKDDEAVSYEVLEQFCGIRAGTMRRMAAKNEPQNAFLSLGGCRRPRFLTFGWCMCPTEIPHCYTIKTCKRGGEAIADTITFRDNSAKYPRTPPAADTPISQPTSGSAGTDDACARPLPQRAIVQAGVDLPSPTLLRAHAAITGVLELSGAGDVFFDLFRLCFWSDSPYPPTSGTPFWESVVAYEGQDICWEVDAHNPLDPEE